jgi:hypothetical protein
MISTWRLAFAVPKNVKKVLDFLDSTLLQELPIGVHLDQGGITHATITST